MLTPTRTVCESLQEIRNQADPGGTEESRKRWTATPIRVVILLMFLGFAGVSIASDIFDVLLFDELLVVRTPHAPLLP
jgi:hypothetical protein